MYEAPLTQPSDDCRVMASTGGEWGQRGGTEWAGGSGTLVPPRIDRAEQVGPDVSAARCLINDRPSLLWCKRAREPAASRARVPCVEGPCFPRVAILVAPTAKMPAPHRMRVYGAELSGPLRGRRLGR